MGCVPKHIQFQLAMYSCLLLTSTSTYFVVNIYPHKDSLSLYGSFDACMCVLVCFSSVHCSFLCGSVHIESVVRSFFLFASFLLHRSMRFTSLFSTLLYLFYQHGLWRYLSNLQPFLQCPLTFNWEWVFKIDLEFILDDSVLMKLFQWRNIENLVAIRVATSNKCTNCVCSFFLYFSFFFRNGKFQQCRDDLKNWEIFLAHNATVICSNGLEYSDKPIFRALKIGCHFVLH